MKRIVSLLCLIALCLSLFACGEEDYPPVESTEREAEVLMRFEAGGKTYARYDLGKNFLYDRATGLCYPMGDVVASHFNFNS